MLAEARTERAVVRLDLVGAELVGLRDVAQLLDVELLERDVGEALDRGPLGAGGDDHGRAQRLAHLELRLAAGGEAEPDGLAHGRHRELEFLVALAGLGPVGQVDARLGAVEVVVDLVGHERRERRQQLRDRDQAAAQRRERRRIAVPEAAAGAADVPVREVVDERGDRVAGAGGVVVIQALGDGLDGGGQPRQRPAIEVVGRRDVARLDPVDVRVHDVEAVRVPELEQELAQRLADRVDAEQVAVPRQLVRQEVPAERVGAVAVDHVPRHDDVAERLRHLLALGVGDVAEAEDGLERALVVEQRRDRDQAVEPAAGLVDRLADVVGRVLLVELGLVLERRVPLGERHRAGVEPDVDHLGHAAQRLAAGRRRDLDLVHERPVRIVERRRRTAARSSSKEPMQTVSPASLRQIGSGVPQ